MKKVLILFFLVLLVSGCGKKSNETVVKDFEKKVNSSKSYKLDGSLEIFNDEDTFTYKIDVSYLKSDNYKVVLVNQINNHEQVILKNADGTYVVTPSLNKSFKFQSDWPNNGSQSYLLSSLITDLKNMEKQEITTKDNEYIVKTNVNYPNNQELNYQLIYLDKDANLKKVEVFNGNDVVKIKLVVNNIDYKAGLDDNDFKLDSLIKEDCCSETTTNSILEEIMYPLYVPTDTYLSSKEILDTDSGNRAILTFGGAKEFVLVEEMSKPLEEFEIIPVYGEPLMLNDTIAALSGNSLYWTSNNIDYYLASGNLTSTELLTIAESIGSTITTLK